MLHARSALLLKVRLLFVQALLVVAPWAQSAMVGVQLNYADFGHLENVGSACFATAVTNSMRYLENRNPALYNGALTGNNLEAARDRLRDGWVSPGGENRAGTGCPGTFQSQWEGKVRYFEDFAPGTTGFAGMIDPRINTNGWYRGNLLANALPTFDFLLGELMRGADVEIGFFKDQLSHAVTLTSLFFDDLNGNLRWDAATETAKIDYLDPNHTDQLYESPLTLAGGFLTFNWNNGGANPPVNGVQLFMAYAERPLPEPASLLLLIVALWLLFTLRARAQRAA